jgi:hypothetical protein
MELLLEVKAYLLDLDEEYKGTENLADTTYEVRILIVFNKVYSSLQPLNYCARFIQPLLVDKDVLKTRDEYSLPLCLIGLK